MNLVNVDALIEEFEWLKSQVSECSKDEIEEIIQRIKNATIVDAVSRGLFEQYKWERDVAIKQLEELGIGFGQKIDGVYLTKEEYKRLFECTDKRYKYGENLFINTQFR